MKNPFYSIEKNTEIFCAHLSRQKKKEKTMQKKVVTLVQGFKTIPAVILQDNMIFKDFVNCESWMHENSFWEKVSAICVTDGGICPDKLH